MVPTCFVKVIMDNQAFSSIDEEEKVWLEREFEEMEVWEVMKGMEGDKAPGSDRFNMAFFQFCWAVVKHDIMAVFFEFHRRRKLVKNLNVTCVLGSKKGECGGNEGFSTY